MVVWAIAIVWVPFLFCAAMWAYWTVRARRGRRRIAEADAILRRLRDAAKDVSEIPEWELECMQREYERRLREPSETDLDELELRAQMDYDAYRFGYRLPGERA